MSRLRGGHSCQQAWIVLSLLLAPFANSVQAATFVTYVTGEAGETQVIFRITFDPAIPGSAVIEPLVPEDMLRLDGIDFLPGSTTQVVIGAQAGEGGGAIPAYDTTTFLKLDDLISDTNAVTPSPPTTSRPSTVLTTPSHIYYIENQFGFSGTKHRIMRTPVAGPADTADVVFDSAAMGALGMRNFEGLELIAGRLYFFAEDHVDTGFRALYSIALDGAGLWDGATPSRDLGLLTNSPGGDGSDELDFDPVGGKLYGTNIISGEIIVYDPATTIGGFLISPEAIDMAPPGSKLKRLATGQLDGLRATGDGYVVACGLGGVILSIDLAGVAAGLGEEDLIILYDDDISDRDYHFDDLTPLVDCFLTTRLVDGPDTNMDGIVDRFLPVLSAEPTEYTLELRFQCADAVATIKEKISHEWEVVSATSDDPADSVTVRATGIPTLPRLYRKTLVKWKPTDDSGILTIVVRTRKANRTAYEPPEAGEYLLTAGAEAKHADRTPINDIHGNPLVGSVYTLIAIEE